MKGEYLKARTFKDFCENQDKLIDILNHNFTEMKIDVKWIKRLLFSMVGLFGFIFVAGIISIIQGG